ncbi:SCO4402 family protein [Nocardioides montaniterrae]
MKDGVQYPYMRAEVVAALESLSDVEHQRTRWGRYIESENFYDDLTLNIHILYDDCCVLPDPAPAVPSVLLESDVPGLERLGAVLTPMLDDLGNSTDEVYLADPRWPAVVAAAGLALTAMR